ncbi:hypothetical protein DS909_20715 [Phaeobacter gallaeciensis]|uniref:Lipoprotein n=2 Tax=Roseobacteraceae TaxID=2854170 RepID=A0A366WNR5_9RHOB|nr:hypothetical protein [Phaeobacter gallaeciensis]MBT3141454.1 hypothetical protein [Falsiruegeria litorea]MBT8167404.1 hypothetical protein [Falsiruegeria litorea]RBW50973.1 hypothetical protein DS909_20715 [Phaeobacter gallaeciensis]
MRRILCACAIALTVAGCAKPGPQADQASIDAVAFRDPGPAYLTLYTMVNNRSGEGGHTSLMVNASQRVIFDPAGSFYADIVPERNDVHYGITPAIEKAYRGAHARSTFHVVRQKIEVTPEQAQIALQLVQEAGPVPGAYCANATSRVLQGIPGFSGIKTTFFPVNLQNQFEKIPGVVTDKYYEDDSDDLQKALTEGNTNLNAPA